MLFSLILLFPIFSGATFPVVDTAKEIREASEAIAVAAASTELLAEFGQEAEVLEDIVALGEDVKKVDRMVNDINKFSRELDSLSEFDFQKHKRLSRRIKHLTSFVKRVKRITGLAAATSSAKAANTIHNIEQTRLTNRLVMLQEQQQINEARKELLKVQHEIRKIKAERRFWNSEYRKINKSSLEAGMGSYVFFEYIEKEEPEDDSYLDDFSSNLKNLWGLM